MLVLDTWSSSISVENQAPKRMVAYTRVVESPGSDLDIWPKTGQYGDIIKSSWQLPATAKLVYSHSYPFAQTYTGAKAEQCIAKVTVPLPDQLFPNTWETNRIASSFQDKIKAQGGDILTLKIYEDKAPTFTTDYYIFAVIAKPATTAFPFPWAVVLILILVLLIVLAFIWLIIEVKDIEWTKPAAAMGMAIGIAAILGGGALLLIAASGRGKGREVVSIG